MNRTLLSLAIIKTNWDERHKDYIDNFVPLLCALIKKKLYKEIKADEVRQVCSAFADEYGLIVPYNPMLTILSRLTKRGLLKKEYGSYIVSKDKLLEVDFSAKSREISLLFERILRELKAFIETNYGLIFEESELENAFVAFLKDHDLDVLFAAEHSTLLPEVEEERRLKYLISKFITELYNSKPELFKLIVDISVGHALAATLLFSEFTAFNGKLRDVNLYFDTPFILKLLSFDGPHRAEAAQELIKILNEEMANLYLLETNLNEVKTILTSTYKWLENKNYDLSKASQTLIYCLRNEIKPSDIEFLLVKLEDFLQGYKISVAKKPSFRDGDPRLNQVDEDKLFEAIVETYRQSNPNFKLEENNKEYTIRKDIESISSIYRLRKGTYPRSLIESKAIFITPNESLAYATRRYETGANGIYHTIPACITDIFLGTLVWLQSPAKMQTLNARQLVADCYAALQPSDVLVRKYLASVEKLKEQLIISTDDYYILRSHRASLVLLENKTLGDPEAFDDSTTAEILDNIIKEIKHKELVKFEEEKQLHSITREQLSKVQEAENELDRRITTLSLQLASVLAKVLGLLLVALFLASAYLSLKVTMSDNQSNYVKFASWLVTFLIGFPNYLNGLNVKEIRQKTTRWFAKNIEILLRKLLNK